MGIKLLWFGLFFILGLPEIWPNAMFKFVGTILMMIGVVLLLLDR